MRLPRRGAVRARIPAAPLFGVALASFACLAPAVLSSSPRGIALGFTDAAPADERRVVWIRVLPGDSAVVDGEPVDLRGIGGSLAPALARDPRALVVLDVRPDVPFQAMVVAYDQLAAAGARNVAIPTQRDIREYIQRYGIDPSEIWANGG